MEIVNNFCDKYNLRKLQAGWLLAVHLVAFTGLIHLGFNTQYLLKFFAVLVTFHHLYALGITAGVHRLWSHKSYQASTPLKILLMLLNSGANQGSIYHWARDHRLHHKFSDTQFDPHTIKRGFFFAHIGWLLQRKSPHMVEEGRKINMDDLTADSIVMFQKRNYLKLSVLMCFVLPAIVYSYVLDVNFFVGYLYAAVGYCGVLNATWCVNSICHMFGSRPWNKDIEPADNYFVSVIAIGEGYHNWHHQYPFDWRASKDEWYMWNPTARFIELSRMLGLASTKY